MRFFIFFFIVVSGLLSQTISDWETITNMNDIRDLKVEDDLVWAATTGGIYSYRMSDSQLEKYTNIEGLLSISVESIELDDHNNLITGGKSGVLEVYDKNSNTWTQLYNIEGNYIKDILFQNDTLWIAAGNGLAIFLWNGTDYKFKDFFKNFNILPNEVRKVAVFSGKIWLGTDQGLLSAPSDLNKYTINDPALWILYNTSNGLTNNNVLDIQTIDNDLWVGTAAGIVTINNNFEVKREDAWGWSSEDAASAIIQVGDKVAVANNNFSQPWYRYYHYNPATGAKEQITSFGSSINCIEKDLLDNQWIGLEKVGLYRTGWAKRFLLDGPVQNEIRYVIKDSEKNIWTSSGKVKLYNNNSISIYDGEIWTNIRYQGSGWYAHGNTVALFEDPYQNVWIGSWGGGLMAYAAEKFNYFHNYVTEGQILITTKDSTQKTVLGDDETIYKGYFNGVQTDPSYEVISTINIDNFNRLWVANYGSVNNNLIAIIPFSDDGFINLDKQSWLYLGRNQKLDMDEGAITCIGFDDFNRAWIGSFKDGVYVVDYQNKTSATFVDHLTVSDNIYSNTIFSIEKDQDGVMWIGTAAGLNSFDGVNIYKHVGDSKGKAGPLENRINQIIVDEYNNKWFATSGGLSILRGERSPWDENGWIGFTKENSGLVDNNVHSIFVDPDLSEALIATENGLSVYRGSFAEIQDNFQSTIGGPNPFVVGDQSSIYTIRNLSYSSSVKILTLNGQLVRELSTENTYIDGSRAEWDGRDLSGNLVSSGIYLYLAFREDGESKAGKIAVIRR